MLLVVLGHAIPVAGAVFKPVPGYEPIYVYWVPRAVAVDVVFSFIFAFHMPLFAFISGVVTWPKRQVRLGERLIRRFKSLMVPYLAWVIIIYWATLGIPPILTTSLSQSLRYALVGKGGVLWFLYALFICVIVVEVLMEEWVPRWILPVTAVAAIVVSNGVGSFRLPGILYLNNVLWIYPFVVLGVIVAPFKEWVIEHRWQVVAAGTALFVPLFYLRNPVNVDRLQPIHALAVGMYEAGIRGGFVLSVLIPYLCALGAVVALYGLYLGRSGWLIDAQAWLGRKSLGIYVIHTPVMWWMVSRGFRDVSALFFVSLGVSVALTSLLERIPGAREILLGQWPKVKPKVATVPAVEPAE